MKIEVLVATMHQNDISKYSEMNLQTDAVIANQADACDYKETVIAGKTIKFITTDTRGASINRNIAITYSTADIIIFADDDQLFVDGYEELVINEFEIQPDADAIKFYCESTNPERPMSFKKPIAFCKANRRNIMSAGTQGFAVKREFLIKNNIFFDSGIGPGRKIYCGEDSVFLNDMIKKDARIYVSPVFISYIKQNESSWFKGYDEQFAISVGYIYSLMYGGLAPLFAFRRAFKESKRKKCDLRFKQLFLTMLRGIKMKRKGRR